jgi:hypothetical protein
MKWWCTKTAESGHWGTPQVPMHRGGHSAIAQPVGHRDAPMSASGFRSNWLDPTIRLLYVLRSTMRMGAGVGGLPLGVIIEGPRRGVRRVCRQSRLRHNRRQLCE